MTQAISSQLPKKTKVFFKSRKESGAGVIIDVTQTLRGPWYVVQRASDKNLFKCRYAQLEVQA